MTVKLSESCSVRRRDRGLSHPCNAVYVIILITMLNRRLMKVLVAAAGVAVGLYVFAPFAGVFVKGSPFVEHCRSEDVSLPEAGLKVEVYIAPGHTYALLTLQRWPAAVKYCWIQAVSTKTGEVLATIPYQMFLAVRQIHYKDGRLYYPIPVDSPECCFDSIPLDLP